MLSPGEHHKLIPRDPVKNVRWRIAHQAHLENNPGAQQRCIELCRQDILFYINAFVVQFNPKAREARDRVGPFISWDFQETALLDRPETTGRKGILWCIENQRTAVVEKSREMGASWLFLIVQDWLCLFHEYSQILNISKSAPAVDDKSPDSLFWKIRFMHRHLPDWLKGPVVEQSMYFGFERTHSFITGEASTGRAGVGGRAGVIFIDEFSQIKEDREVRERTANTSDCRFFNGTHIGPATEFYKLTQEDAIVQMQMHWHTHPEKNKGLYSYDLEAKKLRFWEYVPGTGLKELRGPTYSYPADFEFVLDGSPTGGPFPGLRSPWYDKKALEIGTSRAVAMELDIDPKGSVSSPFDPLMIHQLKQKAKPPLWEGDLEYTDKGEPIKLVEVVNGPIKLWVRLDLQGKPPLADHAGGNDVSAGTGASPSCATITNAQTGALVLHYKNAHIAPDKFGILCAALGRLFVSKEGTPTKWAWEHHGPGVQFGTTLMKDCGYKYVYKSKPGELQRYTINTPGFRPTAQNKNNLLRSYIIALGNREFVNYDIDALDDCLNFKYDGQGNMVHGHDIGKIPEAARDNHGDVVMGDALSWLVVEDIGRLASKQAEEEPLLPPEDNVLTYAGRQALHARAKREEQW